LIVVLWAAAVVALAVVLAAVAAMLVQPKDELQPLDEYDVEQLTRPTGNVEVGSTSAASEAPMFGRATRPPATGAADLLGPPSDP